VVKFLLSTLILVTNVLVLTDTEATTLVVEAVTSTRAVAVDRDTLCEWPVYLATLPGVATEYVTGSPGLTAPSATTVATPATSTLTRPPALAEFRATPMTLGYSGDALYTLPSVCSDTTSLALTGSPAT
jgi:hypothetical protein